LFLESNSIAAVWAVDTLLKQSDRRAELRAATAYTVSTHGNDSGRDWMWKISEN